MTKEELLHRLTGIEWDDFEIKRAQDKLPEDVWETVSAFSNTSGGWVVFGVQQKGRDFIVTGCNNAEKTESDFLNTLRNGQKFNTKLAAKGVIFDIEGKTVLAFYVPSSMFKPIYYGNPTNTFIRSGSGDRRATDLETMAMMREQAFGCRSEQPVDGTSLNDINIWSLRTYRNQIKQFNTSFPYANYPDEEFCHKIGLTTNDGRLTYGGLLMFGSRDAVQEHISNFWIDYLEIPGKSYADAKVRYTFRMQEQDNIWESYQVIIQRLRNYCDNPYKALPTGEGPEDESQLYALREGLVNMVAHADYFSPMHPTIRVYSDRIEFQNPGRFMFPLSELHSQIHSMPRNPSIIKFFRYAKLGENAGYGIDKMVTWESLTGAHVEFSSDIVSSTVTYWLPKRSSNDLSGGVSVEAGEHVSEQAGEHVSEQVSEQAGEHVSEQVSEQVQRLINVVRENIYSIFDIQKRLNIASRSFVQTKILTPALKEGYLLRIYPDKPKHPKQRYYLSEKGLKNVK